MNSTSVPLEKQLQILYKDFPKSLLRHLNFFDLLCTSIGINIFFLGLAALSNIRRWKMRGKSDQDFFLPFILAWIGSFLWTVYGFLVTNWQIELVNGYLTAANSVVLIALYIYRIRKKSLAAVIFITGLATGSLLLLLAQLPNITSVHLVGSICSCIQIGCACTMLYMIVLAIKKKRIDFIPFPPVAQIFNIEFQVTLYSIWIEDFYLLKLGRIHLGITLEASARRLTINVAKIDDLPKYGIYGPPDPYVRITLNQKQVTQSKQTRTLKNTCNPVFKEAVMFLVSVGEEDLENTSLVVSVMDALRPSCPSSVIGEIILSKGAEEKSCAEQWRMMLASPGKEIKASHTLKSPSE
ncbi:Synaptotagmin-C [Trichinella sp. T9]|nr:Synaptotagmin-C [Trichinella sp. T9]